MKTRITVGLALTVLLGACAFGNKYDYTSQMPDLEIATEDKVAIGVMDQRDYVVSGRNTPEWVGLQRSGFGIPYGVHTKSDKPLAHDMTDIIIRALAAKGVQAQAVYLEPSAVRKPGIDALVATGAERSILVSFLQWKSDTYVNIALLYDASAEVFDGEGQSLARTDVTGRDDLGGDFVYPQGHAETAVPEQTKKILERLLNEEEIVKALQ